MPSTALTTWFLSSPTLEEIQGQRIYFTFLFQAQSCRRLAAIFRIFLYKCFIHWDQLPGNLTIVFLDCQPPLAWKVIPTKWQQHPTLTQDFTGFNNINKHRSEATWRKNKTRLLKAEQYICFHPRDLVFVGTKSINRLGSTYYKVLFLGCQRHMIDSF